VASPQGDTALVVGQVVDADSGKGIGDAIVTLGGGPGAAPTSPLTPPAPGRRLLTTANGQFVYRQLAPGRYTLSATKPGYRIGIVGQLVPRGPGGALEIRPGEKLTDVRILMWKQASITGRILDEAGEPVVGAEVRVQRAQLVAGRPGFANIAGATTDDRGVYRIGSLDPGTYVVCVPSASTSRRARRAPKCSKRCSPRPRR
jgi:hypothetical protein